jgi:hydroxymethylbilane synthase
MIAGGAKLMQLGDMSDRRPIIIATRGSALALAQSNMILAQCRKAFPKLKFELKIIKTTGDKLQTASLAKEGQTLPKGLFTKELEVALLKGSADLAVHSLKDLPTELPAGLTLGAVGGKREDVRDVLIYRDESREGFRGFKPGLTVKRLPSGAVVATSSTRRKAQLLAINPAVQAPDIRGNVPTRLKKVATQPELDATILAKAGISRLKYQITKDGRILGEGVPEGLLASVLDTREMLPCVGQAAIGIEVREGDELLAKVCSRLNHAPTYQAVLAERAFLAGMGGGCQSPVAAHAQIADGKVSMRVLSFTHGPVRRAAGSRSVQQAVVLGQALAAKLKG